MAFKDKRAIRDHMLKIRGKMDKEEVKKLSNEIMNKLKRLPIYKESQTIMLYLDFNNEVISYDIIEECLEMGKRVLVPFCVKSDMRIVPTEIKDLNLSLRKHNMGYMEPREEFVRPVSKEEIDLIVLPGIAFDRKGYRIGLGAGYYDRFLGSLNFKVPTVGVAYDFQVLDTFLVVEQHDIPVDYVITEKTVIIRS